MAITDLYGISIIDQMRLAQSNRDMYNALALAQARPGSTIRQGLENPMTIIDQGWYPINDEDNKLLLLLED